MTSIRHAMHRDYSLGEFNRLTGPEIMAIGDKLLGQLISHDIALARIGAIRYSFWFMTKPEFATDQVRVEAQVECYEESR